MSGRESGRFGQWTVVARKVHKGVDRDWKMSKGLIEVGERGGSKVSYCVDMGKR